MKRAILRYRKVYRVPLRKSLKSHRGAIFLILLILCLYACPCWAWSRAKEEVKKGNFLYDKGKFEEALKSYEQALSDVPESDIVNFNLGAALYKAGTYKRAIEHFEKSLVTEEESLEQNTSYNIGNAKYKYGIGWEDVDLSKAIKLLEQSLRHYTHAIKLNPEDEDARYNYEFVKKELERLKKKKKEQKQQKQQQQEPPPQSKQPPKDQDKDQDNDKDQDKDQGEGPQQDKDQDQGEGDGQPDESDQDKGQGDKEQEDAGGRPQGGQPPPGMSEQEAEMLLDNYQEEEEPDGLYKGKIPTGTAAEDFKDW